MPESIDQLAHDLLTSMRRVNRRRYVLAIAGGPGSGKSTLAGQLVDRINTAAGAGFANVLAMDGFHLPNAQLDAAGQRHRKGAPHTYDSSNFVRLVDRLRHQAADDDPIGVPIYCRDSHEPVADAIRIEPWSGLVIVEGQYVLLEDEPWRLLYDLFDESWFLDSDTEAALQRVMQRHMAGGNTEAQARKRIDENDRPNALRVEPTRQRAGRVIAMM